MNRDIILYADNGTLRDSIEDLVAREFSDYKIKSYSDWIQLSDRLDQDVSGVALVVLDDVMPKMDGIGVINLYAQEERMRKVPFIFFSRDGDMLELAREWGARYCILKDDWDMVLRVIREALNQLKG